MRIQPITPFNVYNYSQNKKQQQKIQVQNNAYNPIAYNDVSFTARLCWTPEEFYALPYNKNGMPETMKQYLNADFEDRQHMRPQDVMALVFDDINETKNLEQVKRIFPDEPLFNNLTDIPNRKAKTGILAEIDLMKDENKSLFKNGKDNLGHYILKKIYIEGKTLKEINEDFDKDKSVYYNGLSPIQYDTLRAFGIKFPNQSFWKSFTHNRDNFKYVYTPRKQKETRSESTPVQRTSTSVPRQRGRFEGVKDWEIDRLADALNRGNGSSDETKKQLKKSSVRDEASLNFVAKYMGEINSVVLEKLHVSPEMREFFENPDNLSKSQKQKMEAYWQDSERRELRSTIMKDTIKLFFDAYGVDGQNDEFKELIDYAHGIKPARLAQMEEHNRIQAEYDAMFAELDAQEAPEAPVVEPKSFDEHLENAKKGFNVQEYRFVVDGQEIVILSNLREALQENIQAETAFMPKAISNKFTKFVVTNDELPESYILSKLLQENGLNLPEDDRLMLSDDVFNLTQGIYQDFNDINPLDCRAGQQAVIDNIIKFYPSEPSPKLMTLGLFEYIAVLKRMPEHGRELIIKNNKFTNERYSEYRKPLSDAEARKISFQVFDVLKNYDITKSVIDDVSPFRGLQSAFYSMGCYLKKKNPPELKDSITKYIKEYGGSMRYMLDKNASSDMKTAKVEQFLINYALDNRQDFYNFITKDEEGLLYIRSYCPELYNQLYR